jgi:hypothetical protein
MTILLCTTKVLLYQIAFEFLTWNGYDPPEDGDIAPKYDTVMIHVILTCILLVNKDTV